MFGIDPLTLSSLLVLASANAQCPKQEPTQINVIPRTEKVKTDHSQSLKKIQTYGIDTIDPYSFHNQVITQAFMRGSIELKQDIKYGQSTNSRFGTSCVWYKEINVELFIDPEIVIARELYRDPCMRKAIIGHEMKHVRVDRVIVNKYAKIMGKKIYDAVKSRGFMVGPVHISRAQGVANKMGHVVFQILELEYKKLGIERTEAQREVDSLEEYESVDDKCPHFEARKKKLYSGLGR